MLPRNGILHLPKFTIAAVADVSLYSGSTFESHEELAGNIILPDIPAITFPEFEMNNTNREFILHQIDELLNASTGLGLDGAS